MHTLGNIIPCKNHTKKSDIVFLTSRKERSKNSQYIRYTIRPAVRINTTIDFLEYKGDLYMFFSLQFLIYCYRKPTNKASPAKVTYCYFTVPFLREISVTQCKLSVKS